MRWNRWTRVGFALLAPVVVAVMLAAGEWSQPPASAQSDPKAAGGQAAPSEVAKPKGASTQSARPEHVRELQQALTNAGYDPGPIDGKLGPRTKAALRRYVAVPPPQVPSPADKVISQFRSSNEVRQGQ
jgi:peptidoglycan hydrolase-like protein with peptidoglycan-binding domain